MVKLRYGNTNTFLLSGEVANLLIDTDYAGTLPAFYRKIKKHGIDVRDITYVMATHYHPDHIGLISELMEHGVKLLLIDTQTEYVHFSDDIFSREKRFKYIPINESRATVISCAGSREFLSSMGIKGEIISTPSHSADRVSIILDNGNCIVGDLEPVEFLDAYEAHPGLEKDWCRVMSYQPKKIFYAHANAKVMM